MNVFKRFFALLLTLSMVFSLVPMSVFAEEVSEGGEAIETTAVPVEETTAPVDTNAGIETASVDDGIMTAALTLGTKPANGTVTGQPFDTSVSKNHRIPGLVYFNGNLIAAADARWDSEKDGGGMDLVVSTSSDGNTWNYTYAGYLGDNGNYYNAGSTTLMDPVIVTDGTQLYLFADMFPAGYSISSSSTSSVFSDTGIGFDVNGNLLLSDDGRNTYGYYLKDGKIYPTDSTTAVEGYTVDGWFNLYQGDTYVTNLFFADSPYQVRAVSYICMMTSTDGVNWSDPTLLNVKPSGVTWMVVGPGSGLVTQDGNIAFTAYDGSNIYLIYGKDNNWNTVRTNAANNESSIIELDDGTIRAFVKRNGANTICYVDFVKTGAGYSASSLVNTGVTNFSNCMVSSLHYSKTLNGKDVVLVCCPSKPNSSAWNGRFNGKIHVFTLGANNSMSLVGSYALNGESDFFAYSNMAEMSDGTIAVLYEDDCISYAAGNHYGTASHITYTNVNLETALGLDFDAEGSTDSNIVNVHIRVGETSETYTVTGNHEATATIANPGVAQMHATGFGEDIPESYSVADSVESETQYLITKNGSVLTNTHSTTGRDGKWTGASGLYMQASTIDVGNNLEQYLWTITAEGDGYTIMNADGKYLNIVGNNSLTLSDAPVVLSITDNGNTFVIHNGNCALNNFGGENIFASAYDGTGDVNAQLTLYKYTEAKTASTEVSFTGLKEDTTTAVVGDTQFIITVDDPSETVDITVYVDQQTTVTIDGHAYTSGTVADTDKATMTVTGVPGEDTVNVSNTASTALTPGASYLITIDGTTSALTSTEVTGHLWSGTHIKAVDTGLAVTDINVWTLEATTGGYYLKNSNGEYLSLGTSTNQATMGATGEVFTFTWNANAAAWVIGNSRGVYLNNLGNYNTDIGGWTGDGTKFELYEVTTTPGRASTSVTFTGVAEGNTTATVGHVTYNITVVDMDNATDGNITGFNSIVGTEVYPGDTGSLDMNGKKVTALTTAVGSSVDLGVDLANAETVVWSTGDGSIATVDENGRVTGVAEGKTTVSATVYKNGIKETVTIPVHVIPSLGTSTNTTTVAYYIAENINVNTYYTLYSTNATVELEEVVEGELIFFERPINVPFGIVWTSAPHDRHALTYMAATDSLAEYFTTHAGNHVVANGDGYYRYDRATGGAYYNMFTYYGADKDDLDTILDTAVEDLRCDGAMSMGRRANDNAPTLGSSLSFIADPMPEFEKQLNGVLPAGELLAGYRRYDGTEMVAANGDYVYFTITITIPAPQAWKIVDGQETRFAALEYSAADVIDNVLPGAYFYTKELDEADNTTGYPNLNGYVNDGLIGNPNNQRDHYSEVANLNDLLNAEWNQQELGNGERVIELFVVYPIREVDIDEVIVNKATFNYNYSSFYSRGVFSGESSAEADIHVVGKYIDTVFVDFGLPVVITDATDDYGFDEADNGTAKYGEVAIDPDNDTVTYTPTSVLQGPDTVLLYDKDGHSINSFIVMPASTVYYEEGFAEFTGNWDSKGSTGTGTQELQFAGTAANNFGYDGTYAAQTGMSNGTEAVSSEPGSKATFTFTGNGVDIYANCDTGTGIVAVVLYQVNADNSLTVKKVYQVATATKDGTTDATSGQAGTAYALPIVAISNLPHGTYKVEILVTGVQGAFHLDGFRVYNTITTQESYSADERYPTFIELRDEALFTAGVNSTTTSSQIFSISANLYPVKLLYLTDGTESDLLENGPKNEIWLSGNDTLSFFLPMDAQIGLKAPNGSVTVEVYSDSILVATYTITSATDMFYDIPRGTVTIQVSGNGIVSITKLKAITGGAGGEPLGEITEDVVVYALRAMYPDDDVVSTFADVSNDTFYYDSVMWAVENGITTGTTATTFAPLANCNRAQVVTFLWRAAGSPEPNSIKTPFVDVDADAYYYKAVLWAVENGITNGVDATHFDPMGECDRAQVVTFLWRAEGSPVATSAQNPFADVSADAFYYEAVLWAVENGITSGVNATSFAPNVECNRAHVVTFLYRAMA